MTELSDKLARLDGLPRRNGELVFAAPWQGRAFGMALALTQQRFEWESFRRLLVEQIADEPERDYYASWLAALEQLVLDGSVTTQRELVTRQREFLSMERDGVF